MKDKHTIDEVLYYPSLPRPARYIARHAAKPAWHWFLSERAKIRRRRLDHVKFVGVTGSCGKTTAHAMAVAVLRTKGPVISSGHAFNAIDGAARTILSMPLTASGFCVLELGSYRPGVIRRHAAMTRPGIAVITNVGHDHCTNLGSLEDIALEKGALVESLPEDGVAVLNADDPRVLAMRTRTRARVISYGLSPEADVRAEQVSSSWPDRLCLTVAVGLERTRVQTQLVGEHWTYPVLSAFAVAVAAGIELEAAANAIAQVQPSEDRFSVHPLANDITFVMDTKKAPYWTFAPVVAFLRDARARRKVLVVGSFSEIPGDAATHYQSAARDALEVADDVFFAGAHSHHLEEMASQQGDGRLHVFGTLLNLREYLDGFLEPGDLVVVKGWSRIDHMERLLLARQEDVVCWRRACGLRTGCSRCKHFRDSFVPPGH